MDGMKHTKTLNNSRKGDFAEYYAVTWLWDQGYEVFQNSGCTGPVDMIALKGDELILIDVKTFYERNRTHEKNKNSGNFITGLNLEPSHKRTKKQIKMGVKILGFNPETRELRFVEHIK
jgi:hypothetical protein